VATARIQCAPGTARNAPSGEAPSPGEGRVSFGSTVLLSKGEAFEACQALADADRALLRAGRIGEADALGDLFELLEQRLSVVRWGPQAPAPDGAPPASGRYSIDNELTQ
jgi:hypothetical protein